MSTSPDTAGGAGFATRAVHAGQEPDPVTGAVTVPIHPSSTFAQDGVGGLRSGFEYARSGNPTRRALETCLASLEGGSRGLAFASGLAAEDAVVRTLCRPGSHLVIPDDAYGGTFRLLARVHGEWGVEVTPVRLADIDAVRDAVRPGQTALVWVETPTNPLLGVADIAAIADVAHAAGALLVVDNTFASSYLQQPLALGADVVVHSTTKYAGGHSDVVGGAVVTAEADLGERIAFLQNAAGAVAGPFDSWLVLRGLKTLALRMERHSDNATAVARHLQQADGVGAVHYPRTTGGPRLRGGVAPDAPPRGDGLVPAGRRFRRGRRVLCGDDGLHSRGEPGRGGVAGRAAGGDDPPERQRLGAGGAGRPGAALGGHRGHHRPALADVDRGLAAARAAAPAAEPAASR